MLYLTEDEVCRLLPMQEAIRLLREAFSRLARGEGVNQPRRRLFLSTGSVLHYMAAADGPYFGAKLYSTHPRGGARFVFLLYGAADGALLALLEANRLGQIRTGAASGLATDLLARPEAATAGMIGTGFQAAGQLEAVAAVRPLRRARVWSRSPERRAAFAARMSEALGIPVEAPAAAREALLGSDIVITATSAREPVLESAWVEAGCHVNAIGSNHPSRRELPAGLLLRAGRLVVDSREQARLESGDLIGVLDEAGWQGAAELAEIVSGRAPGRKDPGEVTVFKSLGLALEDVAVAGYVYEQALRAGLGRPVSYS